MKCMILSPPRRKNIEILFITLLAEQNRTLLADFPTKYWINFASKLYLTGIFISKKSFNCLQINQWNSFFDSFNHDSSQKLLKSILKKKKWKFSNNEKILWMEKFSDVGGKLIEGAQLSPSFLMFRKWILKSIFADISKI